MVSFSKLTNLRLDKAHTFVFEATGKCIVDASFTYRIWLAQLPGHTRILGGSWGDRPCWCWVPSPATRGKPVCFKPRPPKWLGNDSDSNGTISLTAEQTSYIYGDAVLVEAITTGQ